MKPDPIVEEVRRIRLQIEREVGGGSEAFYRHMLKLQEGLGDRLVCRKPRRLARKKGSVTD